MNKHVKQLFSAVTVILVVIMALLVTLMILGFVDRALFISMSLRMVAVMAVLTAASALILHITGLDKGRR